MPGQVSIVTPVLDAATSIERNLASVRAQRPHVREHIVMDGGSTDGTVAILERQADDFMRFESGPDAGIAAAANRGLAACSGAYLGILNADDWYEEGAIAKLLAVIAPNAIAHGRLRCVDGRTGAQTGILGPLVYDPKKHFRPHKRMPAYHPTCLVPAAIYRDLGMFSYGYTVTFDYDFLLRCHKAEVEFRYVPEVIANFSSGGISGRRPWRSARELLAARIINGESIGYAFFLYLREAFKNLKYWRFDY